MIVVANEESSASHVLRDLKSRPEPLPLRASLASRAAAAVQRGELDLRQASKRYRTAIADIETWQRALEGLGWSAHGRMADVPARGG